jgi:serine/threonine protein kinase
MAPEQARGLEIDGRADLYAIGCVAWWLVTGKTPFDAADAMGQLLAHVNTPVPDLRALRPDLPETLVALINDLLAKDPAARPADAREIIRRLRLLGPLGGDPWDDEIAAVWWVRNRPKADSQATQPVAAVDDVATAPTLPLPELGPGV